MLGALLSLTSAALFGLNNAAIRRGVLTASVMQAMAITVPLGVPVFLVLALVMGGFPAMAGWGGATWVLMALAGVIHFVIGRYGNYRCTQALGSTLSTPIQQMSIVVALVLAFAFLGETVNSVNLIGILLVTLGPLAVMGRRNSKAATAARARGFTPEYGPGLAWGVVASLGYGSSPLLIAEALRDNPGFGSSIAGGLISYVAATVIVLAIVMAAGGRRYMAGIHPGSSKWFLVSAVAVALSQAFRYLALAVAPVSVVVPIQRLSVVFRILFSHALNRDHEVPDVWVLVTVALSLVGTVMLTVDTGWLVTFLGLPEAWRAALTTSLF